MKKIVISASLAVLLVSGASAEMLGLEAGVSYWMPKASGFAEYQGDEINLEDDLGYGDDETATVVWGSFVHFIPLVPNIKVQRTIFKMDATENLSRSIKFGGKTYNISAKTYSEIDLTQTDFIAYYQFLNLISLGTLSLDLGINVKYLQGNMSIKNTNVDEETDIDIPIPMLYAKGKFNLPFTGLSLQGELSYLGGIGDHKIYDGKVSAVYETSIGFGAEVGYREEKLKIDDLDDFSSDITIKGPYASLFYHF